MSPTVQPSPLPDPASSAPAGRTLESLLACWVEWTGREGDGIRAGNWVAVAEAQSAKRALQPLLEQARESRPDWIPESESFLVLERRNLEILREVRHLAGLEKDQLDRSRRSLAQLQRSYVARMEPVWECSA